MYTSTWEPLGAAWGISATITQLSVCPSILSVCLCMYTCIYVYRCICYILHVSIYHPSTHPSIISICPSVYLSIHPSLHHSRHPSTHPSIISVNLSIYPYICLSILLSRYLSFYHYVSIQPASQPAIMCTISIIYHLPISHQSVNPLSHPSSATSLQPGRKSLSKFPGRKRPRPHLLRSTQPRSERESAVHDHVLLSETPAHLSFPATPCWSASDS